MLRIVLYSDLNKQVKELEVELSESKNEVTKLKVGYVLSLVALSGKPCCVIVLEAP